MKEIFKIRGNTYDRASLPSAGLPEGILHFIACYLDDSEYMLARTSGSTGTPKPISCAKVHMKASALKTLQYLGIKPGSSCLLCLSPEHIAGMMMLVRWLEGHLDLYYVSPEAQPLAHMEGPISFAAMVPYQAFHSLDNLNRIEVLLIGGGELSAGLEKELQLLPGEVYHTYGMTETLSHVALRQISPKGHRAFSALPNVHFEQDHRGCLVVHAPDIGVHQLVTNDAIELLDHHRFYWLGRYDNVVNSGGIKLYPESIEARLGDIGCDYVFSGLRDMALGQKLVMVLASDREVDSSFLQKLFATKLKPYEKPRQILRVDALPRTLNGKVRRAKLREQIRSKFS